jgi:hypothetical protein
MGTLDASDPDTWAARDIGTCPKNANVTWTGGTRILQIPDPKKWKMKIIII